MSIDLGCEGLWRMGPSAGASGSPLRASTRGLVGSTKMELIWLVQKTLF